MTKRVTLFVPLTLPLARTLDLPLELEQAADNTIAGHTVHIDFASVNERTQRPINADGELVIETLRPGTLGRAAS